MATKNPRTPSHPSSNWINRLSWKGFHFALLSFSVYFLVVLVTFDARDPSSTQAFTTGGIHNAGGTFGAILADLFFWAFGIATFLIPVLLIKYEVSRFISSSRKATYKLWLKAASFCILFLSLCIFSATHINISPINFPQTSGGLLGISLALVLHKTLGMWGTNILLLTSIGLSASHFWNLRWVTITEAIGRHCIYWYQYGKKVIFGNKDETVYVKPKNTTQEAARSFSKGTRSLTQSSGLTSKLVNPLKALTSKLSAIFTFKAKAKPIAKEEASVNMDRMASEPREPTFDTTAFGVDASDFSADDVAAALADAPKKQAATQKVSQPSAPAKSVPPQVTQTTSTNETKPAKEIKIVPLSETHKQDTGTSKTETQDRAIKTRNLPPISLLDPPSASLNPVMTAEELTALSQLLETKLLDFGVVAEVVEVNPGPVITRIEISPAPGTKVSKISNLAKDLARSMAVMSVRVVEVIAGKSVIGIEIPNQHREMVRISEVIGSQPYLTSASPLTLTLGNDIAGKPVVVDLAKMPHLLVAGTTGSGKSVGVNAMIMSILLKSTPDKVRMLLVDPKMLELSIYDGIPHLLAPVITDMKEAAGGLRWCVAEMERRYRLMASQGVRNLAGFNDKVTQGDPILDPIWVPDEANGENVDDRPYLQPLPYIVVVVDEFADMIMVVGKKVEELIARIAQKARAAGIHLILATQRPSVDVITGLIKANVPTRIAFQVSSKIDSRTILDQGGAESLLGHGDMLYLPPGKSMPERVHGAFVSDDEVHRVVEAWKKQGAPQFIDAIVEGNYDQEPGFGLASSEGAYEDEKDRLYDEAVAFITETRRVSISSVQRKFKIGYNRAARMVEAMEAGGVISAPAHNGAREVLAPPPPRD